MAFAIMRSKKLVTMGSVAASLQHAFRERETLNADAAMTPLNEHFVAKTTDSAMGILRKLLPSKRRKDAVLAIEYVLTASPEWWSEATFEQQNVFFERSRKWLDDKYGSQNVIVASVHRDETSPHLTAYVAPITADGRLSAKDFIGGRDKMSRDQTSFARCVADLGLERGVNGSKADHTTIKKYYARAETEFVAFPEVVTPDPGPAGEKPGLFAGPEKLGEWERIQKQREQHIKELHTQRSAALETAHKYQAQASEAAALKSKLKAKEGELQRTSDMYAAKICDQLDELDKLRRENERFKYLFTPQEIEYKERHKAAEAEAKRRQEKLAEDRAARVAPEAAAGDGPELLKVYLAVPPTERLEAKQLGARWDKAAKLWFVYADPNTIATHGAIAKWLPDNAPSNDNDFPP